MDKPLIQRLLIFHLDGQVDDPEKIIRMIAAQAGVTRDEVWDIYTEMLMQSFFHGVT